MRTQKGVETAVTPRSPQQHPPQFLYLAVEAGVALGTGALVCAIAVLTRAPVQARLGVTLVDVVLAVAAREAGQADTGEGVDAIHACATVEAGAGDTDTTLQ